MLHGRGSGTTDEYHAAQYIAAQLKQYGLSPAAGNGEYIQAATISTRKVTGSPTLTFDTGGGSPQQLSFSQGKQFALVTSPAQSDESAPLQKLDLKDASASPASVKPGAALLLKLWPGRGTAERVIGSYLQSKAAILIVPTVGGDGIFQQITQSGPRPRRRLGNEAPGPELMLMTKEAGDQLWSLADGAPIRLHANLTPWETTHTWNVLAKITGGKEKQQVILLSAHLDHLGVRNGKTYPGADDDASGTVAVMELARALAKQPQPQRTLVFALWGSEEVGLIGARYFLQNPTFELKDIVANLEFEMIARADPKVKPEQLWLTGWERTNLGPELAAHGAQLVGDPHPDQGFFTRSDNFALAKKGIIAQTVSSYGLHKDYHQPTDTLDRVDWQHLDSAIGSMIAPISWLANSDFAPQWNAGQRP